MEKIIVLGSGAANAMNSFNTCFVLENNRGNYLLVDTGGGNRILKQFELAGIDLNQVHDIFVSHKHIDHILGVIWIYRFVELGMARGIYEGNLNIYCHDEVAEIIRNLIHSLLRKEQQRFLDKRIFIHVVGNHEKIQIIDYEIEFLDILSKSDKQYGFKTVLRNGKTLSFLGDEPLDERLYDEVKNSDYLLHEAFCLESEETTFHARKKNHETVKGASIKAERLGVKNLVLWHSHENLGKNRKENYTEEAKENFTGNVYVPDDFDIIELL